MGDTCDGGIGETLMMRTEGRCSLCGRKRDACGVDGGETLMMSDIVGSPNSLRQTLKGIYDDDLIGSLHIEKSE